MRPICSIPGLMILLTLAASAFADAARPDAGEAFDQTGKLSTGVMAMGGETTGIVLHTDKGDYELAVTGDLVKKAQQLDGKKVHVTGTLKLVEGVEIKQRKIVTVKTLAEVDSN